MELKFNVTGNERKALVEAIAEITGVKPKYLGMPTAAYQVEEFMISKDGTVTTGKTTESMVELMVERLCERGFEPQLQHEEIGLTVAMPRGYFTEIGLENLQKVVDSKAGLIKKALGIDDLPIEVTDEKVSFPWFSVKPAEDAEVTAYTHFIYSLCEMAKNLKRVNAREKEVENEKYAFRCFLLRLGFIGNEYKVERKILLQNFSGSAAFKNGGAKNDISE